MSSYKRTCIILGIGTLTACNQAKNRNGFVFLPKSKSVKKQMQRSESRERLDLLNNNATLFSTHIVGKIIKNKDIADEYVLVEERIDTGKRKDLMLLGQEELLAHEWVYNGTLANAKQIQLLDGCLYDIVPIQAKNTGICGFILISRNKNLPRMRVVFRGTKCVYSALRDLECVFYGGAGVGSFNADKDAIMDQIRGQLMSYQKRVSKKVSLTLSGHSLGGADAQNTMHAILKEIAHQESEQVGFAALDQIKLYHLNSTGVPQEIANECNEHVESIHRKGSPIQIESHSMLVHGDPIQCTGEANIFDEVNPEKVKSKLYKFRKYMSYMDLLRIRPHREKFLIKNSKQREDSCSVCSNEDLTGSAEIKKELRTKSSFLNYILRLLKVQPK